MSVLVAGCNPALQETLEFDQFTIGAVNRVQKKTYSIGGKGQAAARAIHSWNNSNPTKYHINCHLLQFMGGQNGQILSNQLSKYQSTIKQHTVDIAPQQTRTATTLCINNNSNQSPIHGTEIVKPSPLINKMHQTQFLNQIGMICNKYNPNIFQISGTIPNIDTNNNNNMDQSNFYNAMISKIKQYNPNIIIIIDAYKSISSCIKKQMIDILKININELQKLVHGKTEWNYKMGMQILSKYIQKFQQIYKNNVSYLILTDGGHPAYCFDFKNKCYWIYILPKLSKIYNAIGCGDTCTAIISCLLSQALLHDNFKSNPHNLLKWNCKESSIAQATKWGLAAADAATQTMKLGEFEANTCQQMYDKIIMTKHSLQTNLYQISKM